ncbi:amidophosphoribosyltransferase [Terrihabitans soli]|uniref:Amidophosphoribosyltransferase n=1 Tax=Terrihabitans soli TaxID=708113 RepID=A0A6S6QHR8_9HYPH|nr:ComF family protein [Terrihabitans soli]BCJ89724.1 amidophosphoribosyltransferase [Terrihabitans soli]
MSFAQAISGLPGGLRRAVRAVLDIALPPLCLGCAKPVGTAATLCPACWQGMDFIARPYCERLGTPFQADLGPGILSLKAISDPPSFGRARAAARYDGAARLLVHRLKYSDRLDLGAAMGSWMVRAGHEVLDGAEVLVPIPLHKVRFWGRRFNQAGELAKAISRETGLPVAHEALRRVKATKSQVGLSAAERARNLTGAFRPGQANTVRGRRVVLIDDVMTTGSTLNSAANALRRAGVAEVDALVFALVAERV